MTTSILTRLLLAAGSAIAAWLGRGSLWILSRYMRAPLASTGLMAMVTLTALAGSNALYFQSSRHPAPFFSPGQSVPVANLKPVIAPELSPLPAERTAIPVLLETNQTTGSVTAPAPRIPAAPVGNREVFAIQKKLTELNFFGDAVDGFYGPMTANAIRAFEESHGFEPTGALTPAVVDAILHADSTGIAPAVHKAAKIAPLPALVAIHPAPIQQAVAQPVQQAAIQPPAQTQVIARLPTLSPVDNAVDAVGNVAAQTIDSILAAVTMTPAEQGSIPRSAMALSSTAQAMPKPVQVASLEPIAAPVSASALQQAAVASNLAPANNVALVAQIQRGLASLGFYHGSIDGRPGDSTARAIREFENFHSYKLTGEVKPDLVDLLRNAGASI
ncbi:MAG: peptidoglycan-binding protein [Candidatus Devosia symbiotica]|nr:peptidoglycan-binding protein [Candidatus Devosia symbiotica]